uniref:Uncharacterized protein n=1 Tax=Anolis carolinensis TaxID=28377 RepID=G1KQ22_ANOCA
MNKFLSLPNFMQVWDFETMDTADVVDDTGLMEMDPMNELLVGKNVNLGYMVKVHELGEPYWYAQDFNGAIWKLDLSFSNVVKNFLHYCYFLCFPHYPSIIFGLYIIDRGVIVVGFQDGVVRIIELYNPKGLPIVSSQENLADASLRLKQAFKPHTSVVTALAYERHGEILATGSRDKNVFFFNVDETYDPIGFISVPGPVQALQWSPPSHRENKLLIFCENGIVVQVPAPQQDFDAASTYKMKDLPTEYFRFWSIKSQILVKYSKEKEKERQKWIQEQLDEGKELEEIELLEEEAEEEEEEEPLPDIFVPKTPSPILCGFYSAPGKFWLSLRGLDQEGAAEDIEEPNAYSIENAKQKKEHDLIMRAAERKKFLKRQELFSLRQAFQELLRMNDELPRHMQLHRAVCICIIFLSRIRNCFSK